MKKLLEGSNWWLTAISAATLALVTPGCDEPGTSDTGDAAATAGSSGSSGSAGTGGRGGASGEDAAIPVDSGRAADAATVPDASASSPDAAVAAADAATAASDASGGGDGGRSAAPIDIGLPASKVAGTFNAAEKVQFCKAIEQFAMGPDLDAAICRLGSMFSATLALFSGAETDSELQMVCQDSYDTCTTSGTSMPGTCSPPLATCLATVAEIETCLDDQMAELLSTADMLPACSAVTKAFLMSIPPDGPVSEPASCALVEEKCPEDPGTVVMPAGSGVAGMLERLRASKGRFGRTSR